MKNGSFYQMFVEFIQDLFDAENQIVKAMPQMIQKATNEELKEGLSTHLAETKEQVTRLRQIFNVLGEQPISKTCQGIKGLIEEGEEVLKKTDVTPAVRDAFIIAAAQKIEHYEIASYGTACALADHLKDAYRNEVDFEEICDLLDETLEEEGATNKKLTALAEGGFFKEGVNQEAEEEAKAQRSR